MKKFKKKSSYKNKCVIFSPYGIIKENTRLTGKEWTNVLVYGIGNDFNNMFEEIK